MRNHSLVLNLATDIDEGYYMCQATNDIGPGLKKIIRINVNGEYWLIAFWFHCFKNMLTKHVSCGIQCGVKNFVFFFFDYSKQNHKNNNYEKSLTLYVCLFKSFLFLCYPHVQNQHVLSKRRATYRHVATMLSHSTVMRKVMNPLTSLGRTTMLALI